MVTPQDIEDEVDVMDLVDSLEFVVVLVAHTAAAMEEPTASIPTLITILILITTPIMHTIMAITAVTAADTLARVPAAKRALTPRSIIILRTRS